MKSETGIRNEILLALGRYPELMIWTHPTGLAQRAQGKGYVRFGLIGSADIMGICGPVGRAIGLEVKRPGQKQRDSQRNFQRKFESLGGFYAVVHSADEAHLVLKENGLIGDIL